MPEPTPEALREIAYACAHMNATLAIGEAAIEMLIEGPDGDDPDVARAAKHVMEAQTQPLEHWMPNTGSDGPEAQPGPRKH